MNRLLLHICCSICFKEPYNKLKTTYNVFGFFFNPNIQPFDEYVNRLNSLKTIANSIELSLIVPKEYDYKILCGDEFLSGGNKKDRCKKCYLLRLTETAKKAKSMDIEYFSTTLIGSPYQDYDYICETGKKIAKENNIEFIISNEWKNLYYQSKKDIKDLGLYTQKYCGCIYSKLERKQSLLNKTPGE